MFSDIIDVNMNVARKNGRFTQWLAELQDVNWRWVVFPGVSIVFLNVMIVGLVISLYASAVSVQLQSPDEATQVISEGAPIISTFVSPVTHFFITMGMGYWVARRQATAVYWYGLLIGVVSGVLIAVQVVLFTGLVREILLDWTLLTFLPFPMLAGWIGARRSLGALAGEERLYLTSQNVRRAQTPVEIVHSIGQQLANKNVNAVGLWEIMLQAPGGRPTAVSLLAAWSGQPDSGLPPGFQLNEQLLPAMTLLQPESALQIKAVAQTAPDEAVPLWQSLNTRSLLLIPLLTPAGHWVGLMTVNSPTASGMPRGLERDFVTIGAQVALVLENMRLVAQARETAVLQERQRLARDIHDTLAQGFTSIVMHLEAAEQGLPGDVETVQRHMGQARQMARDSLAQARRVVDDLRPEVLESAPLHEAIARVIEQWQMQSGIVADLQTTGEKRPLHPQVEVTLLRSVQEALANVRKHARARSVSVTLSYMEDVVILDVQDDGMGMAEAATTRSHLAGGFGLVAMRERVEALGGELIVESEPEDGTTISVSLPIQWEESHVA